MKRSKVVFLSFLAADAVVLGIIFLLLLLPKSEKRAISSDSAPENPEARKNGNPEVLPLEQWVSPRPVASSEVQVTFDEAEVDPDYTVGLIGRPGVNGRTGVIAIKLSIRNISYSKRIAYKSWAASAKLKDNFNNYYKPVPRRVGIGVETMTIDPGDPVRDTLLFETPISTAKELELVLPAGNVGSTGDLKIGLKLQTSGSRLQAVTEAAKAAEADSRARAAASAAGVAAAQREEAQRKEGARQAEAEAKARQREADLSAEKARKKADEKRLEAESESQSMRLAEAKAKLVIAKEKLRMVVMAESGGSYTYSGPRMPEDYFDDAKKKYIYYGKSQRIARNNELQAEIKQLTSDIASFEARIAAKK